MKTTGHKKGQDVIPSAAAVEMERRKTLGYEYLCHLEEAKIWLEVCLHEKLPPATELEENLRNGVVLAKLGHYMTPDVLPKEKIFDIDQRRYSAAGLQFRHTDNINHFIKCLTAVQLPLIFHPEVTDIYDKKNMPRTIYCIHALGGHLYKLGKAPQIVNLFGSAKFTNEQIKEVNNEFKKYGVNMPPFQNISGLLTNTVNCNTTALHETVLAINDVISRDDIKVEFYDETMRHLLNPAARLENINPKYRLEYYHALQAEQELKSTRTLKRSKKAGYVKDEFDDILTQAEIQGHINTSNVVNALYGVFTALTSKSKKYIAESMLNPVLEINNVIHENISAYKARLHPFIISHEWKPLDMESAYKWRTEIQRVVDSCNEEAVINKKPKINRSRHESESSNQEGCKAVMKVNMVLREGNGNDLYQVLLNGSLDVATHLDEFAVPLYFKEMKVDQLHSKKDLTLKDIKGSIRVLTALAEVSKTVDTGNADLVYLALSHPVAHVQNLDPEYKIKYYQALRAVRQDKVKDACPLLTYNDIQEAIDFVNKKSVENNRMINILRRLNTFIRNDDNMGIQKTITEIFAIFKIKYLFNSFHLRLLKQCLKQKEEDGMEVWLEDVLRINKVATEAYWEAEYACKAVSELHLALLQDDVPLAIRCMQDLKFKLSESNKMKYIEALKDLRETKKTNTGTVVPYTTSTGLQIYMNVNNFCYVLVLPSPLVPSFYFTVEEIKSIVERIDKDQLNEHTMIRFQARLRGCRVRKRFKETLARFRENTDKIIKIQAWWRGTVQRKLYKEMLIAMKSQSAVRRLHQDRTSSSLKNNSLEYYKGHEKQIIKIQALCRGHMARKAYHSLLRRDKPPFSTVRHFSSILNFNAEDYKKDHKLQLLKNDVVKLIKHNSNLSQQLNSMDIKIGLLIQNRITLQDVVALGKNLENLAKDKNVSRLYKHMPSLDTHRGLKSLTEGGQRMSQGYQHLFYTLQTNPVYLSKLLFLLPQSKSTKFLQNVILTLFNFGSNLREEYLLLKLLGSALREEIRSRFEKPSEVVTGNPLVLKMAVNYARQLNGQRALREILGPIIERILADKSITIETNPVDIYKCWRNQLEMETGATLKLPYTVNQEQALEHDQVRTRLENGIKILKITVSQLLERIITSRDLIPYGMLYMAKTLHDTLKEKFPNSPEKDILKVVGNLIYYHFINAAIVAPDAFEIVTIPVDRTLTNDQRRNVASIAKILQFAASKKGFGDEAPHLMCLNPFIIECHEKFKAFFRYCCEIEDLDDHFSINEYTEATLIQKPEIFISLQEICDTHSLFLQYQDQIAPDPSDQLHELLEDVGSEPTVAKLLGLDKTAFESNLAHLGKSEVCLVLSNKFEVPEESDDTDLNKLFIKTKELLVSVLQFLEGDSLAQALEATSSPVKEETYKNLQSSLNPNDCVSLEDRKLELRKYLNKLQLGGCVSQDDDYQSIITAVANDLCNKGKYRLVRNKELQTLKITKQNLEKKSNYYKEQVAFYNEYLQRCLDNLSAGKGSLALKSGLKDRPDKLKSKLTVKYTGAKLIEKGILLEVGSLTQTQLKNVTFEISPSERSGVFTIIGRVMGVEVERIDVDIQQLLELQFEGSAITDMFGKARVNVNLLLHLLNRKFYGKH